MERRIANEILTALHESSFLIDKTLGELKGACPEEPFRACAKLLGHVMSDMFDTVMAPIYDEHSDLAPAWYRDGPPRGRPEIPHLKLPPEARQALLTAFETAYEKIQSAIGRVSQLSDPLEVALYCQGLHQISVALCRARVTLRMQNPSAESPLCWYCKKRVATKKYTHPKLSEMVCAICLDRLEVQDALERKTEHIYDLAFNEKTDEALACLAEFEEANRHRDHDRWMARSIAADRALILFEAGRYAEAEKANEAWAQLGFAEVCDRWMHGFETARTLDALGRPQEGLVALENALSYRDPKYIESAIFKLATLAELSDKLGQPVDPKWRSLAEEVAKSEGVDMPGHDSLGNAILELAEIIRRKSQERPDEWQNDDNEPA